MSRTHAPANPAGLPTDKDHLLAGYRSLENVVDDLRGAAAVLEVVEEDTIMVVCQYAEMVRRRAEVPENFEILILTPTQSEALRHATYQLRFLVHQLYGEYYGVGDKRSGAAGR